MSEKQISHHSCEKHWFLQRSFCSSLHKNWSFPLRIYLVNVTKFPINCGFGHIYWRNPYINGKLHFNQLLLRLINLTSKLLICQKKLDLFSLGFKTLNVVTTFFQQIKVCNVKVMISCWFITLNVSWDWKLKWNCSVNRMTMPVNLI